MIGEGKSIREIGEVVGLSRFQMKGLLEKKGLKIKSQEKGLRCKDK